MKFLLLLTILLQIFLNAYESKLELGLGIASVRYPNYMGSKSYSTISVPYPYINYSSKYLNIDKDGINRNLFNIKNLNLYLSVSGSLPSTSKNNDLRKGMPELNFTFEVGPKLSYRLYKSKNKEICFDFAIRAVFETDLKMLDTQGLVATPELKFEYKDKNLELTFRSGLRFANDRYHNYYYGVDKKYETSTRQSYNAKAGYSGYKNKLSFTYKNNYWWYGAYLSYNNLNNTTYEYSPLIETKHAIFTGVSLAYIFYVEIDGK